jgi:cytochrome bd-type quinol oxidase subunit 2
LSIVARGVNRALVAGLIVFIAGVVRDLQWHATHATQQEFETASKQAEVHLLLWLGALVLLVVTWLTLSRPPFRDRSRGYVLAFASAVVYAVVSIWHFIEHANGNDPELAHLFLYAAGFGIVAGGILALLATRRGQKPEVPRPM